MSITLVLGGGGAVGVAYHCGVLRALEEVGGVDVRGAEVIIGTSGGAVMAADLALGRTYDEIAAGVAPELDEHGEAPADPVQPAWGSRVDLARRAVGSSYVVVRTTWPVRFRVPEPPRWMQRAFPGSLYAVSEADWATTRFPVEWPEQKLWLVASDLDGAHRVVLDAEGTSGVHVDLPTALMASCAVPVVFPPVRAGGRRLVDGGVTSSTNLDLAVQADPDLVIALAPMGFDPRQRPPRLRAMARGRFNREVAKEFGIVRRAGKRVALFRPGADEIQHHSTNVMALHSSEAVMASAYAATVERLEAMEPLVSRR